MKLAIVISILLHAVLFGFLVFSSIYEPVSTSAGGNDGTAIDAIMINPDQLVQQYNQHQAAAEKAAAEKAAAEKAAAEKAAAEKAAAEKAAAEKAAAEKAAAEKAAAEKAAAEKAAAKKAAAEKAAAEKATAEKAAAEKAAAEKAAAEKATAEKAAAEKRKAEQQKQTDDVSSLLDSLTSGKNAPQPTASGRGNTTSSGVSQSQSDAYKAQIQSAIQNRFYDYKAYAGKTCELKIKLAQDGLLLDITPVSGDPALCQAAVTAARQATMPKPPNEAIYELFRNAVLEFKPGSGN